MRQKNVKICVECGKEFFCPPSSKKITCSAECRSQRRSRLLKKHSVSGAVKQKISSAAKERGFTKNLQKGTPAARKSPYAGKFEANASAKRWCLLSPDGKEFTFDNLNEFIRRHIDMFDGDNSDKNIKKIASHFTNTKRNARLKNKPVSEYTVKGWTILWYDDIKNCERKNYRKI